METSNDYLKRFDQQRFNFLLIIFLMIFVPLNGSPRAMTHIFACRTHQMALAQPKFPSESRTQLFNKSKNINCTQTSFRRSEEMVTLLAQITGRSLITQVYNECSWCFRIAHGVQITSKPSQSLNTHLMKWLRPKYLALLKLINYRRPRELLSMALCVPFDVQEKTKNLA